MTANEQEKYMTSSPGYFRGNITCVYHITNPYPENPLYFTIYRVILKPL